MLTKEREAEICEAMRVAPDYPSTIAIKDLFDEIDRLRAEREDARVAFEDLSRAHLVAAEAVERLHRSYRAEREADPVRRFLAHPRFISLSSATGGGFLAMWSMSPKHVRGSAVQASVELAAEAALDAMGVTKS